MTNPSASSPPTQLVLLTPVIADAEAANGMLAAALSGGPVAAVVARLSPADDRSRVNAVKILAPVVQKAGAALVVEAPVEVAVRGGADGCHLVYEAERLADAVRRLAPERMVGVAGLRSRDDAMAAGERGADYVMFGEPAASRHADRDGQPPPFPAVVERVGWWADLFEVPVIGFSPDMAGVAALARVRADFVAIADPVWTHPEGPKAGVAEALAALAAGVGR